MTSFENVLIHKITVSRPIFDGARFVGFEDEKEIQYNSCVVERDIKNETEFELVTPLESVSKVQTLYSDVLSVLEGDSDASINYMIKVTDGDYQHVGIITYFEIESLEKGSIRFLAKGIQYFFKRMYILSYLSGVADTDVYWNKVAINGSTEIVINELLNYAKKSSVNGKNYGVAPNNAQANFNINVTSENNFFQQDISGFGGDGIFVSEKIILMDILNEVAFSRKKKLVIEDYTVGNEYRVRITPQTNKVIKIDKAFVKNIAVAYNTDKINYISFVANPKENYDSGNTFRYAYSINESMKLPKSVFYKADYLTTNNERNKNTLANATSYTSNNVNQKYSVEYSYDLELTNLFTYGKFKVGDKLEIEVDVLNTTNKFVKDVTGYQLTLADGNVATRKVKLG